VRKIVPITLLLATVAAKPGDCAGGNGGGQGQLEEKIKPGSPVDVSFGNYKIVARQGYAFFQDQVEGTEREVFATELKGRLDAGTPAVVLDVRPPRQYDAGHIPGAINIPVDVLFTPDALVLLPTDGTPLVVVSADGHAAGLAAGVLGAMGYDVYVLRFGMLAWVQTTDVPVSRPDRMQTIRGLDGPIAQ
jgi:rhodanese-related sulfurtransferase